MSNEQHTLRVALGADHGGFALKEALKAAIESWGYDVVDLGAHQLDPTDDYPDYARLVGEGVVRGEYDRGILICGTGLGMSYAANHIPGVRAALCHDCYSARMSREHNDANVLCLGGRVIGIELALEITRIWLSTPFSGNERHCRRIQKFDPNWTPTN